MTRNNTSPTGRSLEQHFDLHDFSPRTKLGKELKELTREWRKDTKPTALIPIDYSELELRVMAQLGLFLEHKK